MNALPDGDALALAQGIRNGDYSARELLDAAIKGAERINPQINAIIRPLHELAQSVVQAGAPDGVFSGVPFLLKDLLSDVAGYPTAGGSRLFKDVLATQDSELVKRCKKAGLVIFGKTNTPEFGLTPYTEPALFGPSLNPWDVSRTTGGSSGGSAAAVAAGLAPMGGAGDGGGSIRIPASCCGLVGLKPTRGRNPTGPVRSDIWFGAVAEHPLTRTVRDCAAALDALHGGDPGAPHVAPPPSEPYTHIIEKPLRPLRIAFSSTPMLSDNMHPECVAGLEHTTKMLSSLGHSLESAHPPIRRDAFVNAFIVLLIADVAAELRAAEPLIGRKAKINDVEPSTYALGRLAAAFNVEELALAIRELQAQSREIGRWMEDYDVFLCPTLAEPPFTTGSYQPAGAERFGIHAINRLPLAGIARRSGLIDQLAQNIFRFIPNTPVANITGAPSISLPLHWSDNKLPVGMMFTGRFGDEATLLQLARQLEQALPWAERRPPVHALNPD